MEISVSLMRQLDQVEPDLRNVLFAMLEEIERQSKERVTKDEFRELRQSVHELVQAQARTEARMDALAQRMEELAQAQAKTEVEVRKLAKSHRELKTQVAGLSDSVGYGLEDRLMPYIPEYARLEFGLEVEALERKNVVYPDGKYDEVNILARGKLNGETGYLVGECKAKPGKKDADRFASMLKRLSTVLQGRLFPVLIGYTFAPKVENYVAEKHPHIRMAKTYAVEMRARSEIKTVS